MRSKNSLLFLLPLFIPLIIINVIAWICSFGEVNSDTLGFVIGLMLMITGIYVAVVVFIAADDSDQVSFKELLGGFGSVIVLGIIGLFGFGWGFYYMTGMSFISDYDIIQLMFTACGAFVLLFGFLLLRLLKKDNRYGVTAKTVLKRLAIVACSVIGLVVYLSDFITSFVMVLAFTIFLVSTIESLLAYVFEY